MGLMTKLVKWVLLISLYLLSMTISFILGMLAAYWWVTQ